MQYFIFFTIVLFEKKKHSFVFLNKIFFHPFSLIRIMNAFVAFLSLIVVPGCLFYHNLLISSLRLPQSLLFMI